jgi:hypothetical protein
MKNIIHTLSIALAVFASMHMNAQSVTYKYVRNDPFDIKNFSGGIDAMWCELNNHNGAAFGWGLRAEYMMGKSMLFNFDTRIGFGTSYYRLSNENTTNYFCMEGGVGFIFANSARNRNVPILLSTQRVGNYQYSTYIRGGVPAKVRLIAALRLGIYQYNNTLVYSDVGMVDGFYDSLLTFKDASGTEYDYKKARDQEKVFEYKQDTGAKAPTFKVDQYGSINMTCIYGGIQLRTIRNLLIDVDGYGYRGNIRYGDWFLDVIFAPVLLLSDFSRPDGVTYSVSYQEKSSLGWRMGWFYRKPKDQGISWKFEFGARPGFKSYANSSIPLNGRNLYAMFTMGLYVPLKIKPMYTGENE